MGLSAYTVGVEPQRDVVPLGTEQIVCETDELGALDSQSSLLAEFATSAVNRVLAEIEMPARR